MNYLLKSVLLSGLACLALPASATTYYATATTFKSTWKKVKSGDTLRLSGNFGSTSFTWKKATSTITIDATKANFTNSVKLDEVSGLRFLGGNYGSTKSLSRNAAIVVYGGSDISFDKPNIVGPKSRQGIFFSYTDNVSVTNGTFKNLSTAVALRGSTGSVLSNNKVTGSISDGFQVYDSHKIKIDHNSCTGGTPRAGAHPDCVQLWSVRGHAPQSDIEISDNYASGRTQGFTSFNASDGGGVRISMLRNRVDVSYPQGIACYGCVDSKFIGNTLTTIRGSANQTRINIVGGRNNIISGNNVGRGSGAAARSDGLVTAGLDLFGSVAPDSAFAVLEDFAADAALLTDFSDAAALDFDATESFALSGGSSAAALAVPEPGVWAMMIAGFGMIGGAMRRRSRGTVAA